MHHEPLGAIEPMNTPLAYLPALSLKQIRKSTVAESHSVERQFPEPDDERPLVTDDTRVPEASAGEFQDTAGRSV
jgi:hypothetical protein